MLELRINCLDGFLCTVNANRTWTVSAVKASIELTTGIPRQAQRLLLGSKSLCDAEALHQVAAGAPQPSELTLVRCSAKETVLALLESSNSDTSTRHPMPRFRQVYLCDDKRIGRKVVVERVRLDDFKCDAVLGERLLREVRLLAALQHENLMRLEDLLPITEGCADVCIVTPHMHLDLGRIIHSKMKLSEGHCQAFVCQILRGLRYLHSAGIVHMNLRPRNIHVNKDCTLKIADFSCAMDSKELVSDPFLHAHLSKEDNTWYSAPELLLHPTCGDGLDMWSVGCILFELQARKPLFPGKDRHAVRQLRCVAAVLGVSTSRDYAWLQAESPACIRMLKQLRLPEQPTHPLQEHIPDASEICRGLILWLLDKVPTKRPSASDALAHPYLIHLRDQCGENLAERQLFTELQTEELSQEVLRERIWAECIRFHPELAQEMPWR